MPKRKIEYKTVNGLKCQRYVGDEGWVICEEQF